MTLAIRRANISTPNMSSANVLPPFINTIPYNLTGFLTDIAPTQSPLVTPANDMYLSAFSATLYTAGTATSTIELLVNNSVVATVTLMSGQTYAVADINPLVMLTGRKDTYSISVPSAGAGASGLGGEIEYFTTK
jgi:hypothetical protein